MNRADIMISAPFIETVGYPFARASSQSGLANLRIFQEYCGEHSDMPRFIFFAFKSSDN